jgi:hypothetical protein
MIIGSVDDVLNFMIKKDKELYYLIQNFNSLKIKAFCNFCLDVYDEGFHDGITYEKERSENV